MGGVGMRACVRCKFRYVIGRFLPMSADVDGHWLRLDFPVSIKLVYTRNRFRPLEYSTLLGSQLAGLAL